MRQIRVVLRRLRALFGGTPDDRDLENEIESHLQLHVDDNLRAGMTLDEARRRALVRLGGVESVKEAYRDRRSIPLLETTLQDARYAIRTLRRNRGATLVGILVMALGIGANTAVFSVVHAVLLNPLPYPDPDRIVTLTYLYSGGVGTGDRSRQVSVPDFLDWQRAERVVRCHGLPLHGPWVRDDRLDCRIRGHYARLGSFLSSLCRPAGFRAHVQRRRDPRRGPACRDGQRTVRAAAVRRTSVRSGRTLRLPNQVVPHCRCAAGSVRFSRCHGHLAAHACRPLADVSTRQ